MAANRDEKREKQIAMEIVVDAYSPEEQAMGWYYYLQDTMQFPWQVRRRNKRSQIGITGSIKAMNLGKQTGLLV